MSEAIDDTDELIFDLQVTREKPFKIKNKKGVVTEYVVKELTGGGGETFQNARLNCVKGLDNEGNFKSVSGLGSLETLLLSLSVYVSETDKLVPLATIKSWPQPMVKKLYDISQKLSNVDKVDNDKDDEDSEKN